jgi:hypothetical protein
MEGSQVSGELFLQRLGISAEVRQQVTLKPVILRRQGEQPIREKCIFMTCGFRDNDNPLESTTFGVQ